jgi:hypothetical protein
MCPFDSNSDRERAAIHAAARADINTQIAAAYAAAKATAAQPNTDNE